MDTILVAILLFDLLALLLLDRAWRGLQPFEIPPVASLAPPPLQIHHRPVTPHPVAESVSHGEIEEIRQLLAAMQNRTNLSPEERARIRGWLSIGDSTIELGVFEVLSLYPDEHANLMRHLKLQEIRFLNLVDPSLTSATESPTETRPALPQPLAPAPRQAPDASPRQDTTEEKEEPVSSNVLFYAIQELVRGSHPANRPRSDAPVPELLRQGLSAQDRFVRAAAVAALVQVAPEQGHDLVVGALQDPADVVRMQAIQAIWVTCPERLPTVLAGVLTTETSEEALRMVLNRLLLHPEKSLEEVIHGQTRRFPASLLPLARRVLSRLRAMRSPGA